MIECPEEPSRSGPEPSRFGVVDASDRNHGKINAWFGRKDDEKETGAAVRFLDGILEKGSGGG